MATEEKHCSSELITNNDASQTESLQKPRMFNDYKYPNIIRLNDHEFLCFSFDEVSSFEVICHSIHVDINTNREELIASKEMKKCKNLCDDILSNIDIYAPDIIKKYDKLKNEIIKDISFLTKRSAQVLGLNELYTDSSNLIGSKVGSIAYLVGKEYILPNAFKSIHDIINSKSISYINNISSSLCLKLGDEKIDISTS